MVAPQRSFHQHDVNEVPEFVRTVTLEAEDKGTHRVDYIVCDNVQTNLYLANLGAIERHPWHTRVEALDFPDWFVFDLDPGEEAEFETICQLAVSVRQIPDNLGLRSYAKTSGSRGIHVYVPIEPKNAYDRIADLAEQIAEVLAKENPKIATAERSKQKRKKIKYTWISCKTPTANLSQPRIPSDQNRAPRSRLRSIGARSKRRRFPCGILRSGTYSNE